LSNRWDKTTYDAANKDRDEQERGARPDAREQPTKERKSIAEQAKDILSQRKGEVTAVLQKAKLSKIQKARAEAEEWEDVGDAVEVEQHVELPRIGQDATETKEDAEVDVVKPPRVKMSREELTEFYAQRRAQLGREKDK